MNKGKAIDLPPFADDIAEAIKQEVGRADFVIGYSAGGRIALELKARFPDSFDRVIAISAHPGLINDDEKAKRRSIDEKWIELLETVPFEYFLEKWYAQPLFAPLKNSPHFGEMRQDKAE